MRFDEVQIGEALTLNDAQPLAARSILRKVTPRLAEDDHGNHIVIDAHQEVEAVHTAAVTHAVWVDQGRSWRLVMRWTTPADELPRWTSLGGVAETEGEDVFAPDPLSSESDEESKAGRRARGLLAAGLHARGELEEALLVYDELLDEREEPSLLNNRGAARAASGDLEGAIRDYSRSIALDDGLAQAFSNRGNAFAKLGEHRMALDDYNRALELAGHMAPIYCNRGLTRKLLGDLTGSLEDFDLSIAIDASFAPGYLARGGVRALVGNLAGAIEDLEHFLQLSPQATQAGQVRVALRRLRRALEEPE